MNHKFAFISLNSIENKYMYGGFDEYDYSISLFLPNTIRKMAKAYTFYSKGKSKIVKFLERMYFDKYILKRIKEKGWTTSERIVFIIYGRDYESYGENIVDYLKERFSDSKIVCYFVDLLSKHRVDLLRTRELFDELFTFDQKEADKYGMKYCMEPFSTVRLKEITDAQIKWDITFVASAKDRFDDIIQIYKILKEKGFSCDFHITQVPKEKQVYKKEIGYSPLNFEELLEHVVQSKCILEIIQGEAYSPTTRFSESVLFNKMLLTNVPYFRDHEEYSNIIYFDDISNIPFDRIRDSAEIDYERCAELLSNKRMMETILSQLQ